MHPVNVNRIILNRGMATERVSETDNMVEAAKFAIMESREDWDKFTEKAGFSRATPTEVVNAAKVKVRDMLEASPLVQDDEFAATYAPGCCGYTVFTVDFE